MTLSLDSAVYAEFQKFCDDNGLVLSKQIEFLIQDKLKEKGGRK